MEAAQAAELAASRRRVVVGGTRPGSSSAPRSRPRSAQPLERCGEQVAALSLDEPAAGPAQAARLAEISREIDAAIVDFRRIVHGVYPPVLTDRGLRAAMESLLTDFDPDASLISHRIPRLAAWVEAGIYFCAAALLREWNGPAAPRPVQVLVGVTSTQIGMTFVDNVADGGPGAGADGGASADGGALAVSPRVLESVRDRVAAMGGQIKFRRDEAARFLVIEVPLTPADLTTRTAGSTAR